MKKFSQFVQMYKDGKITASTMAKAAAFKEELEKTGFSLNPNVVTFLKYLATGLGVSAGLGIVSGVAQLGVKAYEQHRLSSLQDDRFREILKLHPDLASNKDRAKLYYAALIHFSPVVAENPLAAGAYIKAALQYDHVAGGPLPQSVKELSDIQKQTVEARKNTPPSSLLGSAIKGISESPTRVLPSFLNYSDFQ